MKHYFVATLVAVAASSALAGTITLDGQLDAAYGPALAVQNNQTQFGDSNLGVIDYANGSELDGAYAFYPWDRACSLFLAGNLESNFNKLEIFLDYRPGGQNKLRGDNPDVDFNGLNRMGDDGSGNGLTFDAGFEADAYITLTCGGGPFSTYANTAEILTDGGGSGGYIGSGGAGPNVLNGSNGVVIAIDNSNTGGVSGGTRGSSGAGVNTGIEIQIPLSVLTGYAGGDIRVCAFINGGGHDYVSNQVLGGLGGRVGNLGEPRNVNFSLLNGNQYFTIVAPTPPVVGDLTGDGLVNGADLAVVLGAWGPCAGLPENCPPDLNLDGTVDGADLAIVLASWTDG